MKKLALTFDDGPGPSTPAILDLLACYHVSATFFLIGERKAAKFETVNRIVRSGHQIGDHTRSHRDLRGLTERDLREELSWSFTRYFRPPGGHYDARVVRMLGEMGMRLVLWDCDGFDYLPGRTADQICATVDEQIALAPDEDAILLLHDGDSERVNGDRSATVEATDRIISGYRAEGWEFVGLSEVALPGKPRRVSL